MLAENPLKLVMSYQRKSGRYIIQSEDRCLVKFPAENQIESIWRSIFGDVEFSLGSAISVPVTGFLADVGSGTKDSDRQKFCDELALECEVI